MGGPITLTELYVMASLTYAGCPLYFSVVFINFKLNYSNRLVNYEMKMKYMQGFYKFVIICMQEIPPLKPAHGTQ